MFEQHHFLALIVMAFAGILGASATEILTAKSEPDSGSVANRPPTKAGFRTGRVVLLGLAAALAVPVFLAVASTGSESTLLAKVFGAATGQETARRPPPEFVEKLILLAGFCVIAGFAAQRLFESLAAQLLRRVESSEQNARTARETADQAKSQTEKLKKETEAAKDEAKKALDASAAGAEAALVLSRWAGGAQAMSRPMPVRTAPLSDNEAAEQVLESLRRSAGTSPRTPGLLALEVGVEPDRVQKVLNSLVQQGMVELAPPTFASAEARYALAEKGPIDNGA